MAKKVTKKLAAARAKVEKDKVYTLAEAVQLVKDTSYTKFAGSMDIAITTNLDVRKAEQQLRGAVSLPHGTGKVVRVLAAANEKQNEIKAAGADIIADTEKLTKILQSGKFDFDVIVTEPKMMPILGRFGRELGPKGLMPNPKTGTVTPNVAQAVAEIKKGKANYRTDKQGIIHTAIGKTTMNNQELIANAQVIIDTIKKLKPASFKGTYIRNITLSATMGPAIKIEIK